MLVRLGSLSTLLCRLLEEQQWTRPAVHTPLVARLAADGAAMAKIDGSALSIARVRLCQRLAAVCACFVLSMAFFDASGNKTYAKGQMFALFGGNLRAMHDALVQAAKMPAGDAGNAPAPEQGAKALLPWRLCWTLRACAIWQLPCGTCARPPARDC